jgi:hypothetical protein
MLPTDLGEDLGRNDGGNEAAAPLHEPTSSAALIVATLLPQAQEAARKSADHMERASRLATIQIQPTR